jgi:hypothetical protein
MTRQVLRLLFRIVCAVSEELVNAIDRIDNPTFTGYVCNEHDGINNACDMVEVPAD